MTAGRGGGVRGGGKEGAGGETKNDKKSKESDDTKTK